MTRRLVLVLIILTVIVLSVQTSANTSAIRAFDNTAPFANLVRIDSPSTAYMGKQIGVVFVINYQLELGAKIRTRIISSSNTILKELVHLIITGAKRTDQFPALLNITDDMVSLETFNGTVEYRSLAGSVWEHTPNWQTQFSVHILSGVETSTTASVRSGPPLSVLTVLLLGSLIFVGSVILLRRKAMSPSRRKK